MSPKKRWELLNNKLRSSVCNYPNNHNNLNRDKGKSIEYEFSQNCMQVWITHKKWVNQILYSDLILKISHLHHLHQATYILSFHTFNHISMIVFLLPPSFLLLFNASCVHTYKSLGSIRSLERWHLEVFPQMKIFSSLSFQTLIKDEILWIRACFSTLFHTQNWHCPHFTYSLSLSIIFHILWIQSIILFFSASLCHHFAITSYLSPSRRLRDEESIGKTWRQLELIESKRQSLPSFT